MHWRIADLCQSLQDEFQVIIAEQTLSRELRAMKFRKRSARPHHHAQAAGAIDAFKKLAAITSEKGVDPSYVGIWFADDARIGQKKKITLRWARRGIGPSAPQDQRTASTCIFGAICWKGSFG